MFVSKDITQTIGLHLNVVDIYSWIQCSKKIYLSLNQEQFWQRKLKYDYNLDGTHNSMTFKELYRILHSRPYLTYNWGHIVESNYGVLDDIFSHIHTSFVKNQCLYDREKIPVDCVADGLNLLNTIQTLDFELDVKFVTAESNKIQEFLVPNLTSNSDTFKSFTFRSYVNSKYVLDVLCIDNDWDGETPGPILIFIYDITGDHFLMISDYTSICVESSNFSYCGSFSDSTNLSLLTSPNYKDVIENCVEFYNDYLIQ